MGKCLLNPLLIPVGIPLARSSELVSTMLIFGRGMIHIHPGVRSTAVCMVEFLGYLRVAVVCISGSLLVDLNGDRIREVTMVCPQLVIPFRNKARKKILVIVEGLYSMEGTLAPLPQILELKQKYKVRVFGHKLLASSDDMDDTVLPLG